MTDAVVDSSRQAPEAMTRRPPPNGAGRDRILNVVYVITWLTVVALVLIPIAALVFGSLRTAGPGEGGEWTLKNFVALGSEGVVGTILTTLYIGGATAVISAVIGTAIALIVHRTDFRFPNLITALTGLAFYFPSFILAMAWIIIGSPGGILNAIVNGVLGIPFKFDVYSVPGIIFVMVLHQVPFVYLTMRGPIMGMDGVYEEAARAAGAPPLQVLRRVTLPLLGYSVASSGILTFIMCIEQFAIPALLGTPGRITVLATQLYLLCRFDPVDYGLAAAVGLALSAITGLAIWAQRSVITNARLTTVTGKAGRLAPIRLGRWKWPAYILCFGFSFLALIFPAIILIYTSLQRYFSSNPFDAAYTLRNYTFIIESPSTMSSFWNTLIVSGLGALVGVALGFLASYFTLRQRPTGYRWLDLLAAMPFGVPGIVIGLGLLWAYAYLPLPLYGTLAILVVAYVTRYLPYATETIGGQMVQIDKSLEEAAWVSGAGRLTTLRRVLLPIALPSVQGAYFLLFMAFFREISSAMLLYTSATSVISVSIWSFFEQANWGEASALSVIATLIIFIAMSLILWLSPTSRRS
ncbi:MAG: iron ABC transporter permease [Hyphomicrobiaceae bacterium]|nr:iron ABC transporter permease [Hyphomicrobiaceae bacterium]